MKRLVELVVDMQNKIYNTILLKQMDTTEFKIKLLDNNLVVDLSNHIINIIFTKPNNRVVIQSSNCNVENGIVKVQLLEDCVRSSGKAKMEIVVKNTDNDILSSFYIPIMIEPTSKENIESDNTPNYIEEIEKAQNDFYAAEELRKANEIARQTAEATRQTNEAIRVNAENARAEAETNRTAEFNQIVENADIQNINRIHEENKLLKSQIPTGKITGSEVNAIDSSNMPIKSLKVYGGSTQKIRTGKNRLDLEKIIISPAVTKNSTGLNLKNVWANVIMNNENVLKDFQPNITYKATAKVKVISKPSTIAPGHENDSNTLIFYKTGSAVVPIISSVDKNNWNVGETYEMEQTFTTPADLTDYNMLGYTYFGNNDGSTAYGGNGELEITEIMIKESTVEDGTFELYGKSPSSGYPSPIKSVGESWNNFDINSVPSWTGAETTYSINNNTLTVIGKWFVGYLVDVKKNKNYHVQTIVNTNKYWAIGIYTFDKKIIKQITNLNNTTFNTEENDKIYLLFYSGHGEDANGESQFTDIQLIEDTEEKPYRPFGYNLFVEKNGKNLAENVLEKGYSTTMNGVDFTVNDDYSISVKGTATGISELRINTNYKISKGNYIISGGATNVMFQLIETGVYSKECYNVETNFTLNEDKNNQTLRIRVAQGITVDTTVYPMIRFSDEIDNNYEPYFHKDYTIPMQKPLRSLPNEVKDDLETTRVGTGVFQAVTQLYESSNGLKYGINILNINGVDTENSNVNVLCDKATGIPLPRKENIIYITNNSTLVLFGSADDTVETFNEKFAGAEYIYELAEPITEELTEEQQKIIDSITTSKGTTYFSNIDDSEMEIEYYKDLETLFNNISLNNLKED